MKKLYAVAAVATVMSVTSAWAQTTNFAQTLDIAIKGKLIPSGDALSNASLSGNTNPVSFVDLEIINGTTTNAERWIGQLSETATNLFLKQIRRVKVVVPGKDYFDLVFAGTDGVQVGNSSNAVMVVAGTDKTTIRTVRHGSETEIVTNETLKATFDGIWLDEPATNSDETGEAVISGTLDSVK
jgi:hypothetical protein